MGKKYVKKQITFDEKISVYELMEKIEKIVEEHKGKDYVITEITKDSAEIKIWRS